MSDQCPRQPLSPFLCTRSQFLPFLSCSNLPEIPSADPISDYELNFPSCMCTEYNWAISFVLRMDVNRLRSAAATIAWFDWLASDNTVNTAVETAQATVSPSQLRSIRYHPVRTCETGDMAVYGIYTPTEAPLPCSLPRLNDSFFNDETYLIDQADVMPKERHYANYRKAGSNTSDNCSHHLVDENECSKLNLLIQKRKANPSEVLLIHLNINRLQNKFG